MNAIILAAGLGSRFKELTKDKHKALFKVDNEPNLERTIKFLNEIGIFEIHIITGYLANNFEYLKDKFGVNLLYNESYATKNNLSSFALALEYFGDSFVIDGDVVMLENIFQVEQRSLYYTVLRKQSCKKEWVVKIKDGKAISINITNEHLPSLLGVSYFTKQDAQKIKFAISNLNESAFLDPTLYWDNVVANLLDELNISVRQVDDRLVCEMDDKSDLKEIKMKLKGLNERG